MRSKRLSIAAWLAVAGWALAAGCITVPNVVLLDQKTALELQAAGEFRPLEGELTQAGLSPKGEDIPGSALATAPASASGESALGELVELAGRGQDDARSIDRWLLSACVGEGNDGLLVRTPEGCTDEVDPAELARVVERTNLGRRQLWNTIGRLAPGVEPAELLRLWRERHLQRVICGGQVQRADGGWEAKPC